MADKEQFDLTADPFDLGFEVRDDITTDDVIKFIKARDSFRAKDKDGRFEPWVDPLWWLANAKAMIQGGWFTVPSDLSVNDPSSWPLAKTRWLSTWALEKYEDMKTVPFGN